MRRTFLAAMLLASPVTLAAQEKTPAEAIEFFEKKVRPVLVQHCFECHAATAKKVKGGLLLDSRAGMLEGGDNGPSIVPGDPDKSRLIEAIRYTRVDLKMPRQGKLPESVIADLTAWVKMGAPWPEERLVKKAGANEFKLEKRKQEHWSWQPIRVPDVPKVKDAAWPRSDIDRFLLANLEAKGLHPASDTDPRTLIRRLHFDLIGLPPTRAEVEAFVKDYSVPGTRYSVLERTVDRLLASPQFGERWARHWLDLVRYAESRGHEFDFTIPNAYHYRDYVIRALNSDVRYDQFVKEHVAGDQLKEPRRSGSVDDRSAAGFNESILGTAFWFLGEECHSPVDIRQDQADRFDNRIDVMTKTFLGLTVACARCHDHKFDAISTKDYYSLFSILESSNYRLARFDTIVHNSKVAEELWAFRKKSRIEVGKAFADAAAPTIAKLDAYLLTAAGIEDRSKELDAAILKRWQQKLAQAAKDRTSPLHVLATLGADRERPARDTIALLLKDSMPGSNWSGARSKVVVNYGTSESPYAKATYEELLHGLKKPPQDWTGAWLPDGLAFGPGPVAAGTIVLGTTANRPIARVTEIAAAERDRAFDGLRVSGGTQNESGSLGGVMRSGRTLRTPEFTLEHGKAYALVKGVGMVYAGVGQHIMLAGPLHGGLVQKFNTAERFQWIAVNLTAYKGQRVHLEFTPDASAEFALACVIESADAPPLSDLDLRVRLSYFNRVEGLAEAVTATHALFRAAAEHLGRSGPLKEPLIPSMGVANWIVQNSDLFFSPESDRAKDLARVAGPLIEQQQKLLAQFKLESRLAPAMQDGSGTDGHVFIRGNHKTLGEKAPRRFLEALAGPKPMAIVKGSGRLELAEQMIDPNVTPFITRVYVNRVWHHLFGRGIVASVDNFGVLGEAPTHPELLDFLATTFASSPTPLPKGEAGMGWSTKKLIRALVLSRAYQMASTPDAKADEADPQNLLLHRMRVRRLEGEAIRDSILRVSGRLNATMYGPSVPVHLTPFQDGRGKPASGPLDGDGRRSVYLAVRRNFLSSFLLAFDTPSPFSTVGRRTVSNVPAQALILMNDPFVHQQAEVWAKRVMAEKGSNEDRVRGMYVDSFARPPSAGELRACVEYLGTTPDQRRWTDVAHVLINAKEFYFVN
jgi:hypothetical protein